MNRINRYRKSAALFLFFVMSFQLGVPSVSFALTSGPSQPEMKGFEPIGNSDMVDLFTGDFTYNIPLMEVGGYPINLAYHSGAGMDDESSWVGYGWSLSTGSVNRQLRGIPDDFNGTDKQVRELNNKDHITKGGRFSMTLDLLGIPVKKIKGGGKKKAKKLNLSLTASIGVKVDNYRGIGMEIGANTGVSLTNYAAGENTTNDSLDLTGSTQLGSFGINSSSMDGASVSLNPTIINKTTINKEKSSSLSSSIGFSYNSRSGLAGMTLGGSFSAQKKYEDEKGVQQSRKTFDWSGSSFISFNGDTYIPTIDHPTVSNSFTFTLHLGPEVFIALPGIGVTGFYSRQRVDQRIRTSPAFGYMFSEKGKDEPEAIMDFNREKDIPYSKQVNYLPIPIPTYDLFSASSQDGGGQYRLFRGSSGTYFDQKMETRSDDFSLGIEIGAGTYFDVGADIYVQDIKTKTEKWIKRNNFLAKGDFQTAASALDEPAYFKRVGEPVPYDNGYVSKIKGTGPVAVKLPSKLSNAVDGAEASDLLRTKASSGGESISVLKRDKREVRNTTFSYLNAREASHHGLDKTIKDYNPDSLGFGDCSPGAVRTNISRLSGYRKAHHISEVTITGDDGKRNVFGTPVYNTYQEEVTFSTGANLQLRNKGLTRYDATDNSTSNSKGRDNYYSKEVTPPYATSYLLTAILSPDYVDRTGNGVTDDDLGTAVKFNYTKLNSLFKWRTPFANGPDTANYNEGFLSDDLDDKANYVYGEKEIWYLHSIESKTMIAHFITADRFDGMGVTDNHGAVNSSNRLKYLKEIRLYSKSDLKEHNNNPALTTPIKVVHLEYDNSICQGLPNSFNSANPSVKLGKLVLKKLYFTFDKNQKGRLNPYEFSYNIADYNTYDYRQYDRWGNFKNLPDNPNQLNSAEFPYTLQDTLLTNRFARAWQLNKITLPSGGSINVTYESDDYAYVQDKRASQMCFLNGTSGSGNPSGLVGSDYIHVNLPQTVTSQQEMLSRYFEGIENLYFKCLLNLDGKGHEEFVPGYARIVGKPELVGNNIAKIKLEKIKGTNPIAKAGWQFLRTNLPKWAYPGSENLTDDGSDLKKAIKALVTAFGNLKELIYGFEKRAKNKGYSNNINLQKSWVRLCSPNKKKLGGGSRVKRIDISDDWAAMSGASGATTANYSQVYDYTTKDDKGNTISSGVAAYEPMLGNDENPFHQPIRYKEKQFLGLNNYYYIEEPFCESLFPAATVGYSKVTVKTIGSGDAETVNRTGTVVSEFYTAKDYPVKVDVLGLERRKPATDKIFKLIGGVSIDVTGISQGYTIELNDMHGKPKTVNVFNKSGQNISSVEYFYKSENELAARKTLKNDVKVINPSGVVSDGTIGMDVEVYNDMRQQTTNNLGISIKISGGSGAILFFPLPFFFPGIGVNYDKRSFRSASVIKIINRFAIQYKVKKVENGSHITSENLLWDAETGNVLLSKTQNEFDDPVYSMAYPAHWIYDGMGQAYKTLGTVMSAFSTGAGGVVSNSSYASLLTTGDELIDILTSGKYWVINTLGQKRLIDKDGVLKTITNRSLKLVRTGRRNMANMAVATITSLSNPIVGDRLDITSLTKVLDAKATVFNEQWEVPQPCGNCPSGYLLTEDGSGCYKDTTCIPATAYTVCEGDQDGSYSACGTYFYSCYGDQNNFVRYHFAPSNPFWAGNPAGCGITVSTSSGSCGGSRSGKSGDQQVSNTQLTGTDSIADNTGIQNRNPAFYGPLNRCGIWACNPRPQTGTWLGFLSTFNVPVSKTYYIGIAGDNQYRVFVDGNLLAQNTITNNLENFRVWHLFAINLTTGNHTIRMEGLDNGVKAAFGAEIYNNTLQELEAATDYSSLSLIFSTNDMIGQHFQTGDPSCPSGYTRILTDSTCNCRITAQQTPLNPYYTGILGNWRPQSQYAYQVNRENLVSDPNKFGSTNVRKSGAYSVFNPFWKYNYSSSVWQQNPTSDAKWIEANKVNYFNIKGLELENRDALNRYSAAIFGYLESMPVAVASNSRYREIAYDGFEDYNFNLDCITTDTCNNSSHFNFRKQINGSTVTLNNSNPHTGKYSLAVNGSVTLAKTVYTGDPAQLFIINGTGQYVLKSNELAKGFSPIPGKKYVISCWVKDGSPRNATSNVQISVNGTTLISNALSWPVVEGWKRIEATYTLPAIATGFNIQLQSGGGTVYFDDIRIFPFDGQLKSFAYDASSQRLMAELDENNFATFYEYDDEGILIRVKKETEKGIMTIKESRSSYRKR